MIEIIQGLNPNYSKIETIEDVLLENCKLHSSVLRALIDESRFPDYIIEEMMILSAPISNADSNYLHAERPLLSITTIVQSGSIDWSDKQYTIVNLSPRQIFVAKNLQKSICPDGCGESEWKGTDFSILTLTSTTTPLDPAEIRGYTM